MSDSHLIKKGRMVGWKVFSALEKLSWDEIWEEGFEKNAVIKYSRLNEGVYHGLLPETPICSWWQSFTTKI